MMSEHTSEKVEIARGSLHIKQGSYVGHKEQIYKISHMLDFKKVVGVNVETGEVSVLEIKQLKDVNKESIKNYDHTNRELLDISDEEWGTVEVRLRAIEGLMKGAKKTEVEKTAKEYGVHVTTVYRWYRSFLDGGGVMGLLPRKEGYPSGKTRMDPLIEDVMKEVIDTFYLSKQRPKVTAVINKVRAECERRGIKAPSPGTIRNRIACLNEYERLARRHDRTVARDRTAPAAGSFNADYPLQVVQMDHTLADIILVDEETRQPVGRPYLTIAIDIYSRMVCGYYLSFEPPSTISVAMCAVSSILPKDTMLLEKGIDAEWPVWGFMETLHVDNGADFRSKELTKACLANGIKLDFRPVNETQFGGHIERLFGTIMDETHLLPGTTFSNVAEKGKYDAEANASMTISEYEEWLVTFITKVYHRRKHTSLGTSPENRYRDGIFGTKEHEGIGFPPKPNNPMSVLIDFLPYFERTVQRNGVNIDRINYYDPVLRSYVKSKDPETGKAKSYIFRRDPRDVSYVWFYDETFKTYHKIPAADQSFPSISAWELSAAKRKLQEQEHRTIDEKSIVKAHDDLLNKAKESKNKTKRVRRELERKKVNESHLEALGLKTEPAALEIDEEDFMDEEIPVFDIKWKDGE